MKFEKGPYLDLVKNPKDRIGFRLCECGQKNEVRINASGRPYSNCFGEMGCGASRNPKAEASSKALISEIVKFEPRLKKKTLRLAGLIPPIEAALSREHEEQHEAKPVVREQSIHVQEEEEQAAYVAKNEPDEPLIGEPMHVGDLELGSDRQALEPINTRENEKTVKNKKPFIEFYLFGKKLG